MAAAEKKAERKTAEGRVEAYVHPGSKLAVLVEVNCETDFVARTEQFITFSHDVAMQVALRHAQAGYRATTCPRMSSRRSERNYPLQMANENKPEAVMQRIIEGKLAKFYEENCLLDQPFIKDDSRTIQQLLTEQIAQVGENIVVRRFARFQIA